MWKLMLRLIQLCLCTMVVASRPLRQCVLPLRKSALLRCVVNLWFEMALKLCPRDVPAVILVDLLEQSLHEVSATVLLPDYLWQVEEGGYLRCLAKGLDEISLADVAIAVAVETAENAT